MSTTILRLPDVQRRTGLGKTHIYELMEAKAFPESVSLGGRIKGWVDSEVETWIQERIRASRGRSSVAPQN